MRQAIGRYFTIVAVVVSVVFGVWGFLLDLAIINKAAGFWGVVIGFVVLPVTFVAAPWYALIAWGIVKPLLVQYGGMLAAAVIYGIGHLVSGGGR